MKKKKWVVTSVLTTPIIAMISCETPNEIQNDLDLELPPLPQPVLRPEEPSKPEKPKSTTPNEPSPTTPPTTPKPEEPKKIDPINKQPSDDKPILEESKKPKDPSDSLNEQDSKPESTTPSDRPEEPKIERNFPNQPNNKANAGERSLPQKKYSEQGSPESREKLKQVLDSIPTDLTIAKDKVKKFEGNLNSIFHEFKFKIPNDWDYVNFVDPISNLSEKKIKANLDFSNARNVDNKIQNVKLKLTDLNNNVEFKNVSLVLSNNFQNLTNENSVIQQKELSGAFSGIFPSFLAYALTHSQNTINDPIFSNPDYAIENLGFGVGLIDEFVQINNKSNSNYKPYVVKAIANDNDGTLSLTINAKNQDEFNSELPETLEERTFLFTKLAKNNDKFVKFVVDNTKLRTEIKKIWDGIKDKWNKISGKFQLIKLLKDNLQVHIDYHSNKTNYKKGLFNVQEELKGSNHILFPQVIFFNSFLRNNNYNDNNKIEFKLENDNKITYTWHLDYQYLDFNQPITENSDLIPGSEHSITLAGAIDLNQ